MYLRAACQGRLRAGSADRGPALATQREQARVAAERATTRAAELRTRRDAMAASEAAYGDSREAYESAAAAFREAEVAAVRTASECAGARDAVEVAARGQLELARAEEQLAVLTRDRRMHDELDRSYGDLRTELNQRLRPEIAERASRFLSELTDGRYAELELNESYEIVVRLENGSTRTFHQAALPAWQSGDRVKVIDGALHSNS